MKEDERIVLATFRADDTLRSVQQIAIRARLRLERAETALRGLRDAGVLQRLSPPRGGELWMPTIRGADLLAAKEPAP